MTAAQAVRRDTAAWAVAGMGLLLLGVVFAPEAAAAVTVWRGSTAYGHCWLVAPIAAWLLWERRGVLAGLPARPAPWAALLAIPLTMAWLLAGALGIMEGRQFFALGLVETLLMAALGWRLWWALSPAFLYLAFLVPFGAFLTPALQHVTARFIVAGLHLLHIPVEADNFQIGIPEGVFYVAEACAGLRFLIASVAFGVLYAVTMFRSPNRRAAFIAIACVVPVLANGLRGLGIVLLGHALGSAKAGAADHLIYGWVFFSCVIVLLALAGLPFREPPVVATRGPVDGGSPAALTWAILGCSAVVVIASAGPLLAGRTGQAVIVAQQVPAMAPPPGCRAGQSASAQAVLLCGTIRVWVTRTAFAHGSDPAAILGRARADAVRGLGLGVGQGDLDTQFWLAPAPWMLVRARDTGRVAAYAIRVGGVQGVGGIGDRVRMVRDRLLGGPELPVAQTVTVDSGGTEAETLLRRCLAAIGQPAGR